MVDGLHEKWTAEKPTVPGYYRFRYRFNPADVWVQGRVMIAEDMLPIGVDHSETQWDGPYPEPPEDGEAAETIAKIIRDIGLDVRSDS